MPRPAASAQVYRAKHFAAPNNAEQSRDREAPFLSASDLALIVGRNGCPRLIDTMGPSTMSAVCRAGLLFSAIAERRYRKRARSVVLLSIQDVGGNEGGPCYTQKD
jgi:hypothetical protein